MKFLDKENTTEVLFSDNHLLIVNKPAGLLTQPNDTQAPSCEQMAKEWVKITQQKPGNVFLHCIHRIDKPVSGIVIFAKTSKALSRMNELMRAKAIERKYSALLEGEMLEGTTLEHNLEHASHRAVVVKKPSATSKKAVLHFSVIASNSNASLVEVVLQTGRYHQIRAQFSAIDHPILGDEKYGAKLRFSENAIALHQSSICFTHPVTKEKLHFKAPWKELHHTKVADPTLVVAWTKYFIDL